MSKPFLAVQPAGAPNNYVLPVTEELCVGLPGNSFLFGGAGLGAGINALQLALGRNPVWATAQYVSYARPGSLLELEVTPLQVGRNVAQARATASVNGETILTVTAALGDRANQPDHQWETMPDMPPPLECEVWPLSPPQDARARLVQRLEVRMVPGLYGARPRDGTYSGDGRLRMWIRSREGHAVDEALLSIFADYIPAATGAAMGGAVGGNSLDNTLRIRRIAPTQWVMCDVHILAIGRGFAHGDMRLFAEDGQLLAIASQSLILRTFDPSKFGPKE